MNLKRQIDDFLRRAARRGLLFSAMLLIPCAAASAQDGESPPPAAAGEVVLHPADAAMLAPEAGAGAEDVTREAVAAVGAAAGSVSGPAGQTSAMQEIESGERFRVLRTASETPTEGSSEFRVRALEGFLDYDEEEDVFYGPRRTRVEYGDVVLEADRLIVDNRLREVQAEGNVVMRSASYEYRDDQLTADSMRYNFGNSEGVAFNASGQHPPIYFRTVPAKDKEGELRAQFRQLSANESVFRSTDITTCDFKTPHYFIRAREVILMANDRIFFRGATFYVSGVPVMYLPYFSHGLGKGNPWFVQLGSSSRSGFRVRVGYQYQHQTSEPSLEDDEVYETRSLGQARTFVDWFQRRGFGMGFDYDYKFDYDRHAGQFRIYGIKDEDRMVGDGMIDPISDVDMETGEVDFTKAADTDDEDDRGWILWRHHSELTKHLHLQTDVDWFSDPELFYDILDSFEDRDFQRDRVMEREARGALTWIREAWLARIQGGVRDRIGRDRLNTFSDPSDNNLDYNLDPGIPLDETEANSISRDRWGRVSERKPEFNFATRYLPVRNWPLFLLLELDAYNNLDKGLNVVGDEDDAMVKGFQGYGRLLWQWRLSERYTLITKVGAGAGHAERDNDDLGVDELLAMTPMGPTGTKVIDGLAFTDDDETFLVGDDEYNLSDIDSNYYYGDAEVRLNARFSDALKGFLRWRFRETTDDFIGDFYARVGDYTSREDLFNYQLRENWGDANMTYRLLHPDILLFANHSENFKSHGELYPNEVIRQSNIGGEWRNLRKTLEVTAILSSGRRILLAPSDDGDGLQDYLVFQSDLEYSPIHGRWWAGLGFDHRSVSGDTVEFDDSEDFTFFSDEDTRNEFSVTYGRKIGTKWESEIELEWDDRVSGISDISWILQRDLHDALAIIRVRSRTSITDGVEDANDTEREFDVSLGLKMKLPDQEVAFGPREITTVRKRERQPVVAP